MGRGKLPMDYIATEKARKSSFKKRKEGLVKKIKELTILCGIDACLIIYGPQNNDGSPMEVHQWPADSKEVENVLKKYEMKRNESSSKHLNLIDFYGNQTCKINEQISKTKREAAKAKFATKISEHGLENFSGDELKNILNVVDKRIESVTSRIEAEKEKQKMMRGIGTVVDSVKLDDSQIEIRSGYYNPQTYLGEQVTENFKSHQLSVSDFNPYLPLPSLTDTFLTETNYQTDVMADYNYIPALNTNGMSEYIVGGGGLRQFQIPNRDHRYYETGLYTGDEAKSYGMGSVGSYLAAQNQQESVLASVLQGNCYQSADFCCTSGDCYRGYCGWQPEGATPDS